MKSEERHKLQQNELADYLVRIGEKLKPYQNAILGGIILILVALLLAHWWNGRNAEQMEAASAKFYEALNHSLGSNEPSELIAMAQDYPTSPAAPVALLTAADIQLNNGCNLLFKNKAKANSELDEAVKIYENVTPILDSSFLKAQAHYGLGRAKECQNRLKDAKTHYEEVVKISPDGPYGVLAADRLASLNRSLTKESYDKFAKFDPKPFKDDSGMTDKTPLFDPSSMPSEPLIKSDTFGEKLKLNVGDKDPTKTDVLPKEPSEPASDQSDKEEPKATEQKAEEKKAEETKPAETNQPATEPAKSGEVEKPAESAKPATEEKPADNGKPVTEEESAPPPASETSAPAENNK